MTITHETIEKYRESIVHHTQQLVRIKSVESEPRPGMPFGEGVHHALTYMLNLAAEQGFETVNVDGYAGHADYGAGEEILAVLVHLDVVPEGTGWDYPPYGAEIHEGQLYGRGIIDDKGPAVASLFAMKALKDSGYDPGKKIRLIFGTDEESGWKDLEVYFSRYPRPDTGFSPDAEFPLIHGEKGIQIFTMETPWNQTDAKVTIISIQGGNAPNMVPDYCEAVLKVVEGHKKAVSERLIQFIKNTGYDMGIEELPERLVIQSKGISAHGSMPEKGQNAVSQLMLFLNECPGLGDEAIAAVDVYSRHIGMEVNGQSIGCGLEDDISGKLIFNVGLISADVHQLKLTVNTRYPITAKGEAVLNGIRNSLVGSRYKLQLEEDIGPLFVSKEDELVQKLMQVYREETGDTVSEPITIGGGTYARALAHGVAFGPLFPGQEELAHKKNESMAVDDLIRITRIYARALQVLAGERSS
ncbi:MAG: dipeptidase PepV [Bacillota bacterium]|nr:dipeptidase PepV [Bacillota bacterium]MDW7677735.1 dipeptidase PepV [Bacillota bacterium]